MREIIWLIIAALFGYVVYQLYRVVQQGKGKPGGTTAAASRGNAAAKAYTPGDTDEAGEMGEVGDDDEVFVFESQPQPRPHTPPNPSPWAEAAAGREAFSLTLELEQLRREVAQLRTELAAQREQVVRVEAAVGPLKEQLEAALAGQGISPEYQEALVFARRGLDVEAISERCGISVAAAELVRSLAKGGATDQEKGR